MTPLSEFQIPNGLITETYSVYIEHGDIIIDCHRDADGPRDLMYLDQRALIPIGHALLRAAGLLNPARKSAVVVDFPRVVPIQEGSPA